MTGSNNEGAKPAHYILDGHKAVPTDLMTWAAALEKTDRKVARTEIAPGVKVSTIFLGLDHAFGDGPPLIFETMVFGGPLSSEMARYSTWEEAEAGHAAIVEKVRLALEAEGASA